MTVRQGKPGRVLSRSGTRQWKLTGVSVLAGGSAGLSSTVRRRPHGPSNLGGVSAEDKPAHGGYEGKKGADKKATFRPPTPDGPSPFFLSVLPRQLVATLWMSSQPKASLESFRWKDLLPQ